MIGYSVNETDMRLADCLADISSIAVIVLAIFQQQLYRVAVMLEIL